MDSFRSIHQLAGSVLRQLEFDRQGKAFAVAQHPAELRRNEEHNTTQMGMGGGMAETGARLDAMPSRGWGGRNTPSADLNLGKWPRFAGERPSAQSVFRVEQRQMARHTNNGRTILSPLRIISDKRIGRALGPHEALPRAARPILLVLVVDNVPGLHALPTRQGRPAPNNAGWHSGGVQS